LLPQIGHDFYFFYEIGAWTYRVYESLFFLFYEEKTNDAILWAIKMRNSPGDFKRAIIGYGLGSYC